MSNKSRCVSGICAGFFLISWAIPTLLFSEDTYTYENFPYDEWVLIGFPAALSNNDPGDVLAPYFGTVGVGGGWRFSRWDIAQNTYVRYGEPEYIWSEEQNSYLSEKQEIGDPPNIVPGYGYWLIQQQGEDIDFMITGTAVAQDEPYYIALDPPLGSYRGRNMVANPFLFSIDWANTAVEVTYADESQEEMSLLDAHNTGFLDQHAYPWTGSTHLSYPAAEGGELERWDGFWVEHLASQETWNITYKVTHYGEGHQNGKGDKGGDVRSIKLHQPRIEGHNGPWDELAVEPFEYYTDIFHVTVENGTDDVWIEVRVNNNLHWTYFNCATEDSSQILDEAFLVTISDKVLVDEDTYRYEIQVKDIAAIEGLHQIAFDFGDGTNVLDPHPQGNTRTTAQRINTSNVVSVSLRLKIAAESVKGMAKSRGLALGPDEWMLTLELLKDEQVIDINGIGVKDNASVGYDVHDAKNYAPPLAAYSDLYFPHHDEQDVSNYWSFQPCRFAYDVRSDSAAHRWKFEIFSANMANAALTLRWDPSAIPANYDTLQLIDVANQNTVDMLRTNQYSITVPNASYATQDYSIHVSFAGLTTDVERDPVPANYVLLENYPNPFNASTQIHFTLATEKWVRLDIYTLAGKKIRTLLNEVRSPGSYLIPWNGDDMQGFAVPSGIYLYRLTMEQATISSKMLLLK